MELEVSSERRTDVIDITDEVEELVSPEIAEGVCTVFVKHTTASIIVNEAESGLLEDMTTALNQLIDDEHRYRHDQIDDNAAAHLRSMLLGSSVSVPIRDGSLDLGTWQRLLFVDCDGPRRRDVEIRVSESGG